MEARNPTGKARVVEKYQDSGSTCRAQGKKLSQNKLRITKQMEIGKSGKVCTRLTKAYAVCQTCLGVASVSLI